MQQLTVSYPDDLAESVRMTPEELAGQVRLMAAVKMFELGKLTSGQAARLAGMPRGMFLEACATYRVSPFNLPDEDLAAELASDVDAASRSPR